MPEVKMNRGFNHWFISVVPRSGELSRFHRKFKFIPIIDSQRCKFDRANLPFSIPVQSIAGTEYCFLCEYAGACPVQK